MSWQSDHQTCRYFWTSIYYSFGKKNRSYAAGTTKIRISYFWTHWYWCCSFPKTPERGIINLCTGSFKGRKNKCYWLSVQVISPSWLQTKLFIPSPLSFEAQLGPQQLDDLTHGMIDVTLLDASHKTLQELHSKELAFLTQSGADEGVGTCKEREKTFIISIAAGLIGRGID